MKIKPILFNTDMVRALLNDRKTVTRRVVKEPYYIDDEEASRVSGLAIHRGTNMTHGMPYADSPYRPGDILYVREAFQQNYDGSYSYRAGHKFEKSGGWRPSIHMPREAARLFLRVKDVRIERVQEITEEQARAEGAEPLMLSTDGEGVPDNERTWQEVGPALWDFVRIWNSTIKPADRDLYGWDANPWVWVIEFERISKEEAYAYNDF